MSQIFHPSMNAFAKATIFGGVFVLAAVLWVWAMWVRSTYYTQVNVFREQPVPFSHEHHVSGLGIDCRYCHHAAETSPIAGIPATEVCMGCHSQIWSDSPMLEPVRASLRDNRPLAWTRVHDLPDFVYFDHSIHVSRGVACASCHGRVDQMPLMRKAYSLQMEWCLDCHRHPEAHVRPRDQVFVIGEIAANRQGKQDVAMEFGEAQFVRLSGQGTVVEASRNAIRDEHEVERSAHSTGLPASPPPEVARSRVPVPNQLTNCSVCHR